jgi:hypothetical protein
VHQGGQHRGDQWNEGGLSRSQEAVAHSGVPRGGCHCQRTQKEGGRKQVRGQVEAPQLTTTLQHPVHVRDIIDLEM